MRASGGISHSLGSHSEAKCILGMNSSLFSSGRPEKYTLVRKSFLKRAYVVVGLRLRKVGVGQNWRPSPMTVRRHFGSRVSGRVMSCISRFVGRVK